MKSHYRRLMRRGKPLAFAGALLTGLALTLPGCLGTRTVLDTAKRHAYLYVGNLADKTISQYRIEDNGSLTPLPIRSVPTRDKPLNIVINPAQTIAYVAEGSQIEAFTLHADGTIASLGTQSDAGEQAGLSSDNGVSAMTITHDGKNVYAIDRLKGSSLLLEYTVNANGSLTRLGQTPLGNFPNSVLESDGDVYVTDNLDNTLTVFRVNSYGGLTPLSPSIYTTGIKPIRVIEDPRYRTIYVSCQEANNGTGSLNSYSSAVNGQSADIGPQLKNTAITQGTPVSITALPYGTDGALLFTPNKQISTVSSFNSNFTTGALTPLSPSQFTTGNAPVDAVVDPTGKYLYALSALDAGIYTYAVNTQGTPSVQIVGGGATPTGRNPFSIAVADVGLAASAHSSSTAGDIHAHVN